MTYNTTDDAHGWPRWIPGEPTPTFDHSSPSRVPPTPMSAVRGCWPGRAAIEHQKFMANRYECPSCGALPGEPCHADCMDEEMTP